MWSAMTDEPPAEQAGPDEPIDKSASEQHPTADAVSEESTAEPTSAAPMADHPIPDHPAPEDPAPEDPSAAGPKAAESERTPSGGEATGEDLADAVPDSSASAPIPVAARNTSLRGHSRLGDAIFGNLARGSGIVILILMAAIAAFLISKAIPAITADKSNWITTFEWNPDNTPSQWGIGALVYGTLITSLIALILAVPTAVGVALFITQYAPRRVAQVLGYLVDLLAAVPSVIYGLWGLVFLSGPLLGLAGALNRQLSFIPIFGGTPSGQSIFAAGVLLSIMVLPIVAALAREVFLQAPHDQIEAAYALGATRWEMIKYAVLPYGRSGLVSATVLGLGRALGETIAVAILIPETNAVSKDILGPLGNTIAANIANQYGDAGTVGQGALIASGLVLFIITLIVNFAGRAVVRRGSQGARA